MYNPPNVEASIVHVFLETLEVTMMLQRGKHLGKGQRQPYQFFCRLTWQRVRAWYQQSRDTLARQQDRDNVKVQVNMVNLVMVSLPRYLGTVNNQSTSPKLRRVHRSSRLSRLSYICLCTYTPPGGLTTVLGVTRYSRSRSPGIKVPFAPSYHVLSQVKAITAPSCLSVQTG